MSPDQKRPPASKGGAGDSSRPKGSQRPRPESQGGAADSSRPKSSQRPMPQGRAESEAGADRPKGSQRPGSHGGGHRSGPSSPKTAGAKPDKDQESKGKPADEAPPPRTPVRWFEGDSEPWHADW